MPPQHVLQSTKLREKIKNKKDNYHHGVSRVGPLGPRGVFFLNLFFSGRSENRLKRFSV